MCASAAVAFGDVVSSDVVGYQGNSLTEGNKVMGAAFVAVNGDSVDLTDITVTGYDKEEGCEGLVDIQTLDEYGRGGNQYFWYDVPGELYGWLNAADEEAVAGDLTLAPGEGLWISAPSSAYSLQTAGKVPTSGIAVTLREGSKIAVNNTPIAVDLTDIVISGYDPEDGCEGTVDIQTLDEYGRGGNQYFWYDVPGELYGWLNASDEEAAEGDLVINPGEGLWVNAPSTAYSIVFPGVTL